MYYTVWQSKQDSKWYWNLRAANHEIIAHGEGYTNKADCLRAIGLVKASKDAPIREQ